MNITTKKLKASIVTKLHQLYGRTEANANALQKRNACCGVIRDLMNEQQMNESDSDRATQRQVHYLSMEFLMGRSLEKNAFNLGILPQLEQALRELGVEDTAVFFEEEPDAGLGNGGLGRLAACFMDSMTTQDIPATGYSICYQLGIFKQRILNGQQMELPDDWLERGGASWLITKLDEAETVSFGGTVQEQWENGQHFIRVAGASTVLAVPHDMLIAGYEVNRINTLRLWEAKSSAPVNMQYYSSGSYLQAVEDQANAEVISKVLYPADNHDEGKTLRLKQQYFFVSATIQSVLRKHVAYHHTVRDFADYHVFQINDTHPALIIPELMRLLLDEHNLYWEEAWDITSRSIAYTNHTVLSEALEHWPQRLVEPLLPRVFQIICEINARYLRALSDEWHCDFDTQRRMAILWDGDLRMANLCVACCFSVNGVSAFHSKILQDDLFQTSYRKRPSQFTNVTDGVDHRRWMAQANSKLHELICDLGYSRYLTEPGCLAELKQYADDTTVLDRLNEIKAANKVRFSEFIRRDCGLVIPTEGILDVQVKRLHEYKRQLLNALHITALYLSLKENPQQEFAPRTFIFGAKAAPGYYVAKRIIELLNSLSQAVNHDPICKGRLQVYFVENYRVTTAEHLIPAAEISKQISTAGKEASGTSNMKFMMNGAVTLASMDGSNVEMYQLLGDDNIFIFGLRANEIVAKKAAGYVPYQYLLDNPDLHRAVDQITKGFGDGKTYEDLAARLISNQGMSPADEFMLLADFRSYSDTYDRILQLYQDRHAWAKVCLSNIAASGYFSADRSIYDYATRIWNVPVLHTEY